MATASRRTTSLGLTFVPTNIRYRDGSYSNFNTTDLDGFAGFNEVFPIFNWYVVETDATRYKNTGTHVVYDAGGPVDGSASLRQARHSGMREFHALPTTLPGPWKIIRFPPICGFRVSVYCDNADCNGFSIANGPASSATSNLPQGESILPGCRATDGRDSSGRPASWSSAKSPLRRARTAASEATWSTPQRARSMTRPCCSN